MPELTPEIRSRRVAVARDVLAQVAASKLKVAVGSYLAVDCSLALQEATEDLPDDADLQGVVDVVQAHCQVCARGALLLSKARLYNAVPLESIWGMDQGDNADLLADTFDEETLDVLENAFEGHTINACTGSPSFLAVDFAKKIDPDRFGGAEKRLVAAMNNIIENDGEFLP
jgi:hypothetical protein